MKLRRSFSPGIRNLIFDIGNVLIDLDIPATLHAFAALKIGGLRPEDIHPNQTGSFLEYELGLIDDEGFTRAIREKYDGANVSDEQIFTAWNAMLKDPESGRFETIAGLKDHYRLFVLSNTNHQHIKHLRERFRAVADLKEFDRCFERCYYSHTLHLRKPDPQIYRHVLNDAGIRPEETLFIDDNAANISAAAALGIRTFLFSANEELSGLFE